jgi:predicted hydrocarbon binding protein
MTERDPFQALEAELRARIAEDPLRALAAITELRHVVQEHERRAVFRALQAHSWREVGEALGVSKQAAFQRFGRDWVRMAHATLPASALEQTIKDRLDR